MECLCETRQQDEDAVHVGMMNETLHKMFPQFSSNGVAALDSTLGSGCGDATFTSSRLTSSTLGFRMFFGVMRYGIARSRDAIRPDRRMDYGSIETIRQ